MVEPNADKAAQGFPARSRLSTKDVLTADGSDEGSGVERGGDSQDA